jgi:hypothetical protein
MTTALPALDVAHDRMNPPAMRGNQAAMRPTGISVSVPEWQIQLPGEVAGTSAIDVVKAETERRA